jgi:hypothetical protein
MKMFEVPMVVTSLVSLCFLTGLDAPPARAGFTFGTPANLDAALQFFPTSNVFVTCFSSDNREMFVYSDLGGGQGGFDIWVLKRATLEEAWGPPENLGPIVNSSSFESSPSISGDGLELYFDSGRPSQYGVGGRGLLVTRRTTRTSPWGPATALDAPVNGSYGAGGPSVSSDGLELYFCSSRSGGLGGLDIYVSKRATRQDPWGSPVNLGPAVNSTGHDQAPRLSPDGLLLLFQASRPGGFGSDDLWMARRANRSAPWEPVVNLGPVINGPNLDCQPCLAPDGSALYFAWDWSDRRDIPWQAPIIPMVDFNGDHGVDAKDADFLMADWGRSDSVCDIGPFAWGDGTVDEKDLGVLMKSLATPGPGATLVPCDVALSWILPSLTPTCDVYFGTSFADVNNASRIDPCGVLVSQGQTVTTYDPEGFLELQKTCYWRIDCVSADTNPTIYKGAVWQFTTEPDLYAIRSITATASSFIFGSEPEKTIDRSGLDANDLHSDNQKDMWWSKAEALPWIQYEFDRVYRLHEMRVWNHNMVIEPSVGFGAKTVQIEYSLDGTTWTVLEGVPEFARAPGNAGYAADTTVDFGGISAKHVKLTILKKWGTTQQTGLSEVRFYAISAAAVMEP